MPIAASRLRHEVDMAGTSITFFSPRRIIEPLPNCFSILAIAISMARLRSLRSSAIFWCPFLSEVPRKAHYTTFKNQLPKSKISDERPAQKRRTTDDRRPTLKRDTKATDDRSGPSVNGLPSSVASQATNWHGSCSNASRADAGKRGLPSCFVDVCGAIRKFLKQTNPSRVRAWDVVP